MIKKWINKLLTSLFTIFVGSIVIFFISKSLPFDGVDAHLNHIGLSKEKSENYLHEYVKNYTEQKLNLPLFFFSILPDHYTKDLHAIADPNLKNKVKEAQRKGIAGDSLLRNPSYLPVKSNSYKIFHLPKFIWHGIDNQYWHFLKNTWTLNLGVSDKDGKKIIEKIKPALNWTLSIILWSLILSVPISILWSLQISANPQGISSKIFRVISSVIPAIPSFWLATIVLIFFTGHSYKMPLFYTPLYSNINDHNFFIVLFSGFKKISPILFCMMLTDVAYLTRLFTYNIESEMKKPYVLALKAKGYKEYYILWKHVFRNILLPFITVVTNSIPIAFAGTVIYEVVFNVNGIGRLLHESIQHADWKIVYYIAMFILTMTVIIYLIGDYFYTKADPRINIDKV